MEDRRSRAVKSVGILRVDRSGIYPAMGRPHIMH